MSVSLGCVTFFFRGEGLVGRGVGKKGGSVGKDMSDGGFGGGDFARTPSAASDPDLSLYRGGSMGHASMSFHTDDQL